MDMAEDVTTKHCSVEWDGEKCGIELTELNGVWYCQKCDCIQHMTEET